MNDNMDIEDDMYITICCGYCGIEIREQYYILEYKEVEKYGKIVACSKQCLIQMIS